MGDILREYPRIHLEKRFLSEVEVSDLLALAEGKFVRSTVVDNATGDSIVDEYRTGQLAMLQRSQDTVVKNIEDRIASVTGTRPAQGEPFQVVKYEVGDNYKPHYDWFDPALPGSQKQLIWGGQRMATCILCLKQAEEGGETEFPELEPSVKVKLEPGDALFFFNLTKLGKPEPLAKHAGLPPLKGEKIIATRWIRERASDGTEESESLKAKAADQHNLDTAKRAAEEANAKLRDAMSAELLGRSKLCFDEIEALLKKHGCILTTEPGIEVGQGGSMRIYATIEVRAQPLQAPK